MSTSHTASGDSAEFVRAMEPVARKILGEPTENNKAKRELRFGTRGSLCINLAKGTWFCYETNAGGGVLDFVQTQKNLDKDGAVKWLQDNNFIAKRDDAKKANGTTKANGKLGTQVATYDYKDTNGKPLFQVVRFEPKDFRQRRPLPGTSGKYIWNLDGVERVIYHLPELLAASLTTTIYIAEGEKDVDALRQRHLVATCNPEGVGKWKQAYNTYFNGRHVVVVPDNDPQAVDAEGKLRFHPDGRPVLPGQDHAADVAKNLRGIAASVRILMLPNLPPKGDVSDWLAAGGTAEELDRLAREAPEQKQDPPPDPSLLVKLLSIQAWMERQIPDPDRLLGEVLTTAARMFLVGRTGLGKTLLAFAIACGIANGEGFLHWRCTKPKRVLLIDGEMPEGLIKARAIDAMGRVAEKPKPANLIIFSRYLEDEFTKLCPTIGKMPPLNTEEGHAWTLALIDALGGVDVVIFDNVMSLIIGDQKDEVSWSEAMPLVQYLTARNIAQLWLDHTGWNTDRQYGSSTKAWPFNSVGVMAPLKDDQCMAREVAFTLSFEFPGKARRRTPDNWTAFETCIIRLKDGRWTSEPANKVAVGGGLGKVAPSREPFYDALIAAITRSSVGLGRTMLTTWELECLRRGLIHRAPEELADGRKETWQQRDARHKDYRKAKSDLIAAKWIAVDGELVIDLKGRTK